MNQGERENVAGDPRLRLTVALLQATVDATGDAIVLTNESGVVASCNRGFREMWNVPDSVQTAEQFAEHYRTHTLTLVKDPDLFHARLRQIVTDDLADSDDELELIDERIVLRHMRLRRLAGIGGRVWSFRDVTEQRKMQASLVASDRLASMGALAAGVAHEISNPLTYLNVNLNVLAEELPELLGHDDEQRRSEALAMIADARQGTAHVRRIVRDLTRFSRTEDVETSPVDVHAALEFSLNMVSSEVRHRARVVKMYGADVPLVEGNEGKLGQVFLNLLVNAAQAIPEGRAAGNEIRLTTHVDVVGSVVIEVRDTGEGIAADKIENIFRPFFTTKPAGAGTGLGLFIARGIIHDLGGALEVESAVGSGTTFRVTLPPARQRSTPTPFRVDLSSAQGRRGRILVVEDDPRVSKAIERLLAHHDIRSVTTGAAALDRLRGGETYDLILSDLVMPDMTGMDLHARLTELDPAFADAMVLLSGGTQTRAAREFLEHASNEVLDKPLESESLRALVRRRVDAGR